MINSKNFEPNWTSAPGNTISDILDEKGLTTEIFAKQMQLSLNLANDLLNGRVHITHELADKLNRVCGGSSEFWLTRQTQFEDDVLRFQRQRELEWLKQIPTKDMLRYGWINNSENILQTCLDFFKVKSVDEWKSKYERAITSLAFRKSPAYATKLGGVAAWLRRGEIKSEEVNCSDFNSEMFESMLYKMKPLTRRKSPKDFLPTLIHESAKCGVVIAVIPTPSGCPASGVAKFLSSKKALILLSFRYLSDDHFWFTFFHEAGHILLHGRNQVFIEGIHDELTRIQEEEANTFAAEMLIPFPLQEELSKLKGNKRDIINFAVKAGVSPGIVVGQLQHRGYIDKKYLNGFKRRYDWDDINEVA